MSKRSSNKTTRFARSSLCPKCGYAVDTASTADGSHERPTEGDPTLCLNCAAVLVFKPDMGLREPTQDDWQELKKHLPPDQHALLLKGQLAIMRRGPIPGAVQRGPRA